MMILLPLSASQAALVSGCQEKEQLLFEEFIGVNFDKERRLVGEDQVLPVMLKLRNFAAATEDTINKVEITVSMSKVPFFTVKNKKRVQDPESPQIANRLLLDRKEFALKAVKKLEVGALKFKDVKYELSTKIDGPDFSPKDFNLRFVSKESSLFEQELRKLPEPEKRRQYGNIFQAKFFPYEGFTLKVMGVPKCEKKGRSLIKSSQAIKQ